MAYPTFARIGLRDLLAITGRAFSRRTDPAVRMTADRSCLHIIISKDFLERRSVVDPAATQLLDTFQATNNGDWGGPVYPDLIIPGEQASSLIQVLSGLRPIA